MNNLNPGIRFVPSKGVDLPLLKIYLAGRISGDCIDKCLEWRQKLVNYYRNYKGKGVYPISFLDALNSKEADSIDKMGLTSAIPPNLIYQKDILSVLHADVIIANMDDYFEEGIQDILDSPYELGFGGKGKASVLKDQYFDFESAYFRLRNKILNRRENLGTVMEFAIGLYLQKPTILIVPKKRQEIFRLHPFTKQASVIVTSVDQLIKEKWINILYKSISGATYE